MDDKEEKQTEEHSNNPGNPGPSEADFAVVKVHLTNIQTILAQVEQDMRVFAKHSAVCAERWHQHAEEHKRILSSAQRNDAGSYAWGTLMAALAYIFKGG